MTTKKEKQRHPPRRHQRAHLVQVWVSGNVIAPLFGFDANLGSRPGVANPHSLEGGGQPPGGVSRGRGQELHPARRRAPAQRQRGSSREGIHATCRHQASKTQHTQREFQLGHIQMVVRVTFQVKDRPCRDLETPEMPGIVRHTGSASRPSVNNQARV